MRGREAEPVFVESGRQGNQHVTDSHCPLGNSRCVHQCFIIHFDHLPFRIGAVPRLF